MKKILFLLTLLLSAGIFAQATANRFFYELTSRPKKDSARTEKVMTILDITPQKSIYQDYTIVAQDSLIKAYMAEFEKTKSWKDPSSMFTNPKFSYKVIKTYPAMKVQYQDNISRNVFGYDEDLKHTWKIENTKQKIGEYNTQKATTDFGGRHWTAWFDASIPFQDGPYKFYGLPGLIVKLEDDAKDYSWELKGNKKIDNYSEQSEQEKISAKYGMDRTPKIISREKFVQSYNNFKADPLAEMRPYMTPELMGQKMPGSDTTVGEYVKKQEKIAKDYFNSNDNPIEKTADKPKK